MNFWWPRKKKIKPLSAGPTNHPRIIDTTCDALLPLHPRNSITPEKSYSLYYDSVYTTSESGLLTFSVGGESTKESTFVATLTDIFSGLELTPGFGLS